MSEDEARLDSNPIFHNYGMTMRDYFASKATRKFPKKGSASGLKEYLRKFQSLNPDAMCFKWEDLVQGKLKCNI